jgi:hypothetical protein
MATKLRRKKGRSVAWCQQIIKAWEAAGNVWPAPSDVIAEFAIANDLWATHKAALIKVCARELAKAMAQDYLNDEFGRPVRRLHCARIGERGADGEWVQKSLWGDIRTMDHEFMTTSFQQRRCQIVGECRQLQNDIDYYNRNRPDRDAIQFVFDFTDDVIEGNMPTEYRPPRPPQKG